jgi:hypothetical protein
LGQADGTFGAPTRVDSSSSPIIATGDLNSDGYADLVVADEGTSGATTTPGAIHVYLGPAFSASTVAVPTLFFSSIALGDLNGDGRLDIVTGATDLNGNTQIDVLLGNGAGGFGAASQTFVNSGDAAPSPRIVVGDFNGDGNADVAFDLPGKFSGIMLGNGDGTFSVQSNLGIGVGDKLYALALHGNANPGLLVASSEAGGLISLVNQSGQVSIAPPVQFVFTVSPSSGNAAAGSAARSTLTSVGQNGYAGNVSFSCAGLPAGASCQFSSATTATGANTTLNITTTPRTASLIPASRGPRSGPWLPGSFALAGLLLPLITRRLANSTVAGLLALFLLGAFTLISCSGSSSPPSSASSESSSGIPGTGSSESSGGSNGNASSGGGLGTPVGTYPVTISGVSGQTMQTLVYFLTVS